MARLQQGLRDLFAAASESDDPNALLDFWNNSLKPELEGADAPAAELLLNAEPQTNVLAALRAHASRNGGLMGTRPHAVHAALLGVVLHGFRRSAWIIK